MSIEQAIQDFQVFGRALREENRKIFEKLVPEFDPKALEFASAAKDPFEVVSMALIFQQQKEHNLKH